MAKKKNPDKMGDPENTAVVERISIRPVNIVTEMRESSTMP